MKYCAECGNEIQEDERFCSNCGTPVSVDYREGDSEEKHLAAMEASDKNGGDITTKNFNIKDFITSIIGYIIAFVIMALIGGFIRNFFNLGATMRSVVEAIVALCTVMIGCGAGKSVHADIAVGLFLVYDAFAYPIKNWGEGIAAILLLVVAYGKWKEMHETHEEDKKGKGEDKDDEV